MGTNDWMFDKSAPWPAKGRDHGRPEDARLLLLAEFLELERRKSTTDAEREAVDELMCDLPGAMAQMERGT